MKKITLLLFALAAYYMASTQSVGDVQFGKNRVQFHNNFEEWSQYESDNFITYWYGAGRSVGQSTVLLAEYDFKEIEELLDHRMNNKVELIVYTDITDLKQSNIGVEEAFQNVDGLAKIENNKAFIYFNGDHNHLRRQIRQGIAGVYLRSMAIGSNLQEMVQNAVLLDLPIWFEQGLISYAGENWNTDLDDQLRNVFLNKQYKEFEEFAEEQPVLAGHALWYYIEQQHGRSALSNLLYLVRINRNLPESFNYGLNTPFQRFKENWWTFYQSRYESEQNKVTVKERTPIEFKNKRNIPISQITLSPSGQYLAFVTNEIGKVKVHLRDLFNDKTEVIFKTGFRNAFQATDRNYPILAWNPNNYELAILYERQDLPRLVRHDVNTKKQTEDDLSIQLQRVYSMEYTDPQTLLMSANSQGFSDLFLYYINSRQPQAITRDYYDDIDATFVQIGDKRGVIWASNRPDSLVERTKMDSLPPMQAMDLFYYDLEKKGNEAVQITHTPFASERQPIAFDTTYFSYLSDENGIYNRYAGYLEDYIHHYDQVIELTDGNQIVMHIDSTLEKLDSSFIDTIYTRPIIKQRAINHLLTNNITHIREQAQAGRRNKNAELLLEGERYNIYIDSLRPQRIVTRPFFTQYRAEIAKRNYSMRIDESVLPNFDVQFPGLEQATAETEDIAEEEVEYLFQSEFQEETEVPEEVVVVEEPTEEETPEEVEEVYIPSFESSATDISQNITTSDTYRFNPGKIIPYRIKFLMENVETRMDNEQLFGGLNTYSGMPEDFGFPPPGMLFKTSFTDLLEDYDIVGGVRVPTSTNGTEYFLYIDDKKKRLDKRYAFYRRNLRFPNGQNFLGTNIGDRRRTEVQNILGQFSLSYPFDIYRSLRLKTTLRVDVISDLVTQRQSLNTPPDYEQRIGAGLEYVFDNTLDVALNIKNGTRYKVYAETVKRFDLALNGESSLDFRDGFMTILGFDFRHYQRLDKKSIIAVRAAGATSFGTERILFRIGGTDRWIIPQLNQNIPQPVDADFAYRVDMPNLRGFQLNIRNGSSFALLNNELRVPVFRYLMRSPRPFFRNFQLVGFFDAGTAWSGPSPFTEESPLNTSTYTNGPVTVKVNFFRDPIVFGYGAGARLMLFGYYVRVDRSWGVETRNVQSPRWFWSLGMDF
ncbi:MAG: hypothetical protein AAGI23_14910 [Bacteroidota bacterium]